MRQMQMKLFNVAGECFQMRLRSSLHTGVSMLVKGEKRGGGLIAWTIDRGGGDFEFDQEPRDIVVMLEKYCRDIGDKRYGETLGGRLRSNASASANVHRTASNVRVPHDYS